MTQALPSPKTAAALIKAAFESNGASIATKEAYGLLAQVWGYKDWPTARAALKKDDKPRKADPTKPVCVLHTAVQDWPVWVFCNRGQDEDKPLYVYPFGTRLDDLYGSRRHWHLINDQKTPSIELPQDVLSAADAQNVVAEEVACAYPDEEEYGVPACASEHSVAGFLTEELGFSYVGNDAGKAYVEVTGRCRGDDGGTEWWVQVRVHPSVHARLSRLMAPARLKFEENYETLSTEALAQAAKDPACLWASQGTSLAETLDSWFSKTGEYSLRDLMERLEGYAAKSFASNAIPPGFALSKEHLDDDVGSLHKSLATAVNSVRKSLELP